MESLWLLLVLFFVLLMVFPQFFKVYISYDVLKNSGMLIIKLWCFNLKYCSFQLKESGIIIRTKKERKQVEYKFSDPKILFYENFTMQIKQKIKLKKLDIYSNMGTADAGSSAVLSSILNIFYHFVYAYVKNLKQSSVVIINSNTSFNEKNFIISVFGKVSIAIFDVIYCIFIAFFNSKGKKVYKNFQKNG